MSIFRKRNLRLEEIERTQRANIEWATTLSREFCRLRSEVVELRGLIAGLGVRIKDASRALEGKY